ncbi:MAG: bifunctional pyr operon transcriptional regulator/uracil phosphoribosyltransferase PyrR [Flavobacteriaceae bacterium]
MQSQEHKLLLDQAKIDLILHRLACQLIENHGDFHQTVLIGLQPRGVFFAERIIDLLQAEYEVQNIEYGILDTTFFRDDFRQQDKTLLANTSRMEVPIEGKNVVLIDDVLYTGRSIRAALTAIDTYGRPNAVELMVLIDRRFSRHLPIQPDYKGAQIDALQGDKVRVEWAAESGNDQIYLFSKDQ